MIGKVEIQLENYERQGKCYVYLLGLMGLDGINRRLLDPRVCSSIH